jgi:hypothetical protein
VKIDEKTLMTMVNAFYARIANSGNELEAMEFALSFARERGYLTDKDDEHENALDKALAKAMRKLNRKTTQYARFRTSVANTLGVPSFGTDLLKVLYEQLNHHAAPASGDVEARYSKDEGNAKRTDGAVVTPGQELVTRAEFNDLIQVLRDHASEELASQLDELKDFK